MYEAKLPPLIVDTTGGFSEKSRVYLEGPDGVMRLNPAKKLFFHDQHFTKLKSENVYRIAFIGESSVYNLQIFNDLIHSKLEAKLKKKVELLNFGANGFGSTRLSIVAKELVQYHPDLVFIYMGHNEYTELEQLDFYADRKSEIADFLYRFSISRVASRLLLQHSIQTLKDEQAERFFSGTPNLYAASYHKFTKAEVDQRLVRFKEKYMAMVKLFQDNGIQVVMSTIPSNYMAPLLKRESISQFQPFIVLYNYHEYKKAYELSDRLLKNELGRRQSSSLENNIIREVAATSKVKFFDLEKVIIGKEPNHIPGETLFSDHCHLNIQGNLYLIDELIKNI